ncbi:MAG TPA: kelch repeat-containing protein [Gemmataceae bacterium]|nr:kelch repeat-containing protein [Gemmataceae bacterium]
MAWPLSQDYNEAIQSPESSFTDPELRGGQAVTNALGMPMPRSGNFADVYEFVSASGAKWAIKCFTREVPGLQERYSEISKHLLKVKLPFTVDFKYLETGIRIRGQLYPILKMQWVEGFLLNEFVRTNLNAPALVEGLGQIWARMAKRLSDANIAHADLQHGNVLLVPGSKATSLALKLIDYDGMWLPALANKKSGEVGHPAYQHPSRLQQGTYSAAVDRLPLLAIACALRCLTIGGKSLWDRYDNGDNLLFREIDLRKPADSKLFKELWNINDAAAHDLTGQLVLGLTGSIAETPPLQDVMNGDGTLALTNEQERKITEVIGPGAAINRPMVSTPIAPPAKPVPVASPIAPATNAASPEWGMLGSQNSTRMRPKRDNQLLKIGITATVVLFALILLAGGSVGAWLAFNRAETRKAEARTEKKPIFERKSDLRKEENVTKEKKGPTWKSLANMPTARSELAAVTGSDGRIYAIGGANASGRLDTVEVYDPIANTWAKAAPMPTARYQLAATIGPDNLIYAIGGQSSIPKIVEAYNPTTNKWTTVAPTPTARNALAAATGPDGRIYAIGGSGPGGSVNTVEAYDTKLKFWTTVASMPTARTYLAAVTGPDGRIYAIGGFVERDGKRLNVVEAYDTKTNSWTPVASMPTARNVLAAATGPDGRIYAIGGHTEGANLNPAEAYDPSTNTWTTVTSMPTVRGQLAATTGRDGRIYAIGGGGNVGFLNIVEALSFSTTSNK